MKHNRHHGTSRRQKKQMIRRQTKDKTAKAEAKAKAQNAETSLWLSLVRADALLCRLDMFLT